MAAVADGRGNSYQLDADAFAGNVMAARRRMRPGAALYQVIKGDGYGLGLPTSLALGGSAGVDGFCVGTPAEALMARRLAPSATVVLFTASPPASLPPLAAAGVVVSVNSLEALQALARQPVQARFLFEFDCGFGRFGLSREKLDQALASPDWQRRRCLGAYTHFGGLTGEALDAGLGCFDAMMAELSAVLPHAPLSMAAGSNTLVERPDLPYTAADPGRLLYGLAGVGVVDTIRPVLVRVESTLIQLNDVLDGQSMRIGYGDRVNLPAGGRTGVFPLGWLDGLSSKAPFGEVLIGGTPVPVLARTLLHSIVDLSAVPEAGIGDAVVLVGRRDGKDISLEAAAAGQGMSATELHFKLTAAIRRHREEAADPDKR